MKFKLLTLLIILSFNAQASDHYAKKFKLTMTNNHSNQSFSPALIVLHKSRFKLFSVGEQATENFATFAEDGDLSGIKTNLESNRSQIEGHVTHDHLLAPGESVVLLIESKKPTSVKLSIISMAVTSHDVFASFDSLKLPKNGTATFFADFYDAGTEKDSESCKFIPGPPCGNMNVRDPDTALIEPFVGFKGGADINPGLYNL